MLRIGVLISGGGSNLQAIIDAIGTGSLKNVEIAAVVSNKKDAYGLKRAENHGIENACIRPRDYSSKEMFNKALKDYFLEKQVDLIVLAGFLFVLGKEFIEAFPSKIINIHPSLIPAFCGDGYYGDRVHEAVLERGVKISGATVHFVDEGTDTGPIILQQAVLVEEGDTAASLHKRILEQAEWKILPEAIRLIAEQRIELIDGRVVKKEMKALKVLVVGGGGREHAIVWKLKQSQRIEKIYCAPGNGGISKLAECVNIPANKIEELAEWALKARIDLTIIGMDDPLMLGIVDVFEKKGLKVFGPKKNAAIIEGSKVFAKELMKKYNIPTATYEVFETPEEAKKYLQTCAYPIVLKADGLALGKGVFICESLESAELGIDEIMIDRKFGDAGKRVVIEEFMTGPEVSVLAFCDGEHLIPMVSAQDHKRAFDQNQGPNTGGMGTFSPSRYYTKDIEECCYQNLFLPTLQGMKKEGRPFTGILFFGLMLTPKGPKMLEYNARFGDPEAQVILPRLKTDLVDILEAAIEGRLDEIQLEWDERATICVVLSSGGYPIAYKKGYEITGLETLEAKEDIMVFHAGTILKDGKYFTNGGRVLGVTGVGTDIQEARQKAYEAISAIDFTDKHYRLDIGIK